MFELFMFNIYLVPIGGCPHVRGFLKVYEVFLNFVSNFFVAIKSSVFYTLYCFIKNILIVHRF